MQGEKKNSDRRRNERRHDARKNNTRRNNVRRNAVRLDNSFKVSVTDHNGKTVNVSASGVYFEVTTNDIETFSPGTIIPLQIDAVTSTYDGRDEKLILSGRGKVIRSCIVENPDHANRLGVALEFMEKLDPILDCN